MCHTLYLLAICFAPSLADSFIFLTLTRLVVVINFVNFSFALFTPPPSRRLSGDHGGRANLAGGRLGWPVHDEVAAPAAGEIADEAAGRNRRRGWVPCAREDVVRLKCYNNWTRIQRRQEGRTHRSG
jgi:hypothetical protein